MAELKLGPLDELPQLRTYGSILLAFPLPETARRSEVEDRLQAATDVLIKNFSYLGGQITISEASENTLNGNKHVPGDPAKGLKVTINDVPEEFFSYDEIINANAPASMLDGSILGQGNGYPDKITGNTLSPCLGIRANFLKGGLLLTFALMHAIGDGVSLGQVVKLFATACRGEDLPSADIKAGNIDRQLSLPSLRPDEQQLDHSHVYVKGPGGILCEDGNSLIEAPAMAWAYFRIRHDKLACLKSETSAMQSRNEQSIDISSNDAFSALIWRAVTMARSARLKPTGTTTCMRAVNSRRKLNPPLPEATLQNIITATYTTFDLEDFPTMPLAALARKLRRDLQAIDDHHVRSFTTFARSTKDKARISFGANLTPNDMAISSVIDLPVYTSDFGLLGKPQLVRFPTLTPTDGLIFIMPRNPDGGLDVAISIRVDDMERLRRDEKWNYYTEYIG